MAHNLAITENNEYAFAANAGKERKNIAWHGLGQYFDRPMTVQEAITASHADYNVNKGALLHITPEMVEAIKNGEPINGCFTLKDIIDSHVCTYRADNNQILGVVGKNYEVVQNMQGFDFINEITGVGATNDAMVPGAIIETAGVLGNGERMFVTAKLPNNICIGNSSDIVEDYILFTNSHDGSNAVVACFTPVRVVCNNTLNAALSNSKNKVYFKHTKNVGNKLKMAREVMEVHNKYVTTLSDTLTHFSHKKLTDEQIKNIVAGVYLKDNELKLMQLNNGNYWGVDEISTRSKNTIDSVLNCIDNGVGQELYKGSALSVYNGFTSFYNNEVAYKDGKKLDSLLDGNSYKKTQKAMDLLLAA